jgi:hypothetical protein
MPPKAFGMRFKVSGSNLLPSIALPIAENIIRIWLSHHSETSHFMEAKAGSVSDLGLHIADSILSPQ